MTTDFILNHTAREIAERCPADEIWRELRSRTPDFHDPADLFGDQDPAEGLDFKPDLRDAECLIDLFYGDAPDENPYTPESLAIVITLYTAWQYADSNHQRIRRRA